MLHQVPLNFRIIKPQEMGQLSASLLRYFIGENIVIIKLAIRGGSRANWKEGWSVMGALKSF